MAKREIAEVLREKEEQLRRCRIDVFCLRRAIKLTDDSEAAAALDDSDDQILEVLHG